MRAEQERRIKEPYLSLLRKLTSILLENLGENLISVVVYGSVARGEAREDSDIDLLIIARDLPKGRLKRQDLFIEFEKSLDIEEIEAKGYGIDFSPILLTPEEASRMRPLYLDMVEDAVILFDRDGFFSGVLEKLRKRLEELGAERVRLGKKWYWRLKRDYKFGEVIEI
jgi:predicted nucleotidyltransferase